MEPNSNASNNPRGVLSGFMIAIVSALFSTVFYVTFTLLAYTKKMPFGQAQVVVLQIICIIMSVILAQFLARKIQGNKLSMLQALLSGWLTSMMLAIFISSFFTIFSKITGLNIMPKGAFAMLLLLYNGLGLVWSIIIGVFMRKE